MTAAEPVRAAGGAVWRRNAGRVEVLLIHRPRYDDWTLPKGKADVGEDDPATAAREVAEETGLECRLGAELPSTRYVDNKGRPKVVRYWAMEPAGPAAVPFRPNDEVDQVAWMALDEAAARLSYAHDLPVLSELGALVGAPPDV